MPIGPADVEGAVFKERFRGYDQDEVDRFLDRVAGGLAELAGQRDALAAELAALRSDPGRAPGGGDDIEGADELLRRTLGTARQTAEELVAEARRQAEEVVAEARRAAAGERRRVEADAAAVRLAVEQLRRFRDDYRARLHAVMSEQLAALDRAGELPRVPPAVDEVVERLAAPEEGRAAARDAVEAGWAAPDEDVTADEAGDGQPPWEQAWDDPWSAAQGTGSSPSGGEA